TDSAHAIIDSTILVLMRDNPSIIAEISSHTDSKGTESYNERLSQRRAQSVVDYLIKNGIEKERLQAKGYGENQPIAQNTNPDGSDNPMGRQKNRRTEFRVIGILPEYSEIIYKE
nr:OmpA family protein [Bacteroidota bacterium]